MIQWPFSYDFLMIFLWFSMISLWFFSGFSSSFPGWVGSFLNDLLPRRHHIHWTARVWKRRRACRSRFRITRKAAWSFPKDPQRRSPLKKKTIKKHIFSFTLPRLFFVFNESVGMIVASLWENKTCSKPATRHCSHMFPSIYWNHH